MIAFPGLLAGPAEEAGMKVPPDPDRDFDPSEYPHFLVFCRMQLGQPMPDPSAHWDNAKVIASIPDDEIKSVTAQEILDKGFRIGLSK